MSRAAKITPVGDFLGGGSPDPINDKDEGTKVVRKSRWKGTKGFTWRARILRGVYF